MTERKRSSPPPTWPRQALVKLRGTAALATLFVLGVLLPQLFALSLQAAAWTWGVGIPLVIAAVIAWHLTAGRRLRARGEGLDLREDVRGPVGTTLLVRGQVDGRTVRVFRDRVEVDVVTPRQGALSRDELAGLAGAAAAESPYASAREAAAALTALGIRALDIEAERVVIRGGQAPARALVPLAVRLALAPARIRFAPGPRPHAGCPYCHQPVSMSARAPALRCPTCEAVHHAECWQEHGGCSVFRCRRAPSDDRERPADRAQPPGAPPGEVRPLIRVRERA